VVAASAAWAVPSKDSTATSNPEAIFVLKSVIVILQLRITLFSLRATDDPELYLQARASRRLGRKSCFDRILEPTQIIDLRVADFPECHACESGAATRSAVKDNRPLFAQLRVVVTPFGIGTKLKHPARDVQGAFELPRWLQLGRVPHVQEQGIAPIDEFVGLLGTNLGNSLVCAGKHLLD
jgi:hypothetical protein